MLGILVRSYTTDHKHLAMRLMRAVNPMNSILPWATQNMRPNPFTIRLYDLLVAVTMAIQGCVVGSVIDLARWLKRRGGCPTFGF
jgi:hypothetical protein